MITCLIPFHAAIAGDSTDLANQIAVATKHPAEVAKLTHEAISADVKQAAQTVRIATEVAPPLATVVTAAAVHAAPHRTADIAQAVAAVTPIQSQKVQVSADIASALTANPAESIVIVGAEIVVQPEQAATIMTAAVTVCSVLEACPQNTVEDLVQAAVQADRSMVETIVGAVVRLLPEKSGAIIAAAAEALVPRATVPPVRSTTDSEPTAQPAPQQAQVAESPVPDLTQLDTGQRARVAPVWTPQANLGVPQAEQSAQHPQAVQEDQDIMRRQERTSGRRQLPGRQILNPDRPPVLPASPFF